MAFFQSDGTEYTVEETQQTDIYTQDIEKYKGKHTHTTIQQWPGAYL